MLKIVNITFEYIKNTKVLRGLNGEFNKGLNIVFANRGEGKTTLLDLLLFPKQNQNAITLNGERLTKQLAKAEISAIQSDWFLKENKSVKENFDASKHQNNLSEEFLSSVDFFEISQRKTSDLTLSEKFKTALLRALKKTPSLLVLDSPFAKNNSEKCLLKTLENVILNYEFHMQKPLCVLLLSRPFDVQKRDVSLLISGCITCKDSYENIRFKPNTTTIATDFSAYPNNVFARGTQNYYVAGEKVKIGSEYKGAVSRIQKEKITVEFEEDDLEIIAIEGYKIGDEISLEIPKEAVIKLDIKE